MPSLRDFFRSDAFVPTTAVFPPIDAEQLASDLALIREGTARGTRNQPRTDEDGFDAIENKIIERVGDLRRKGVDNYAANVRVYDARLARASDARQEVEMTAAKARGDFQAAVTVWQANMASPSAKVSEAFRALQAFRQEHGVLHVARHANFWQWLLVAVLVVVVEGAANAMLFAQVMSQGLAGGLFLAMAISATNVAIASLTTYFGRNLSHRRWLWRLFGLAAAFAGIALCVAFNLGVAHLRDAMEAGLNFEESMRQAWVTLLQTPLELASFLSALLLLLGLLAAIIVGLKTYHAIDPYPGYPGITATVIDARDTYAEDLKRAIHLLEGSRDEAIDQLRDGNVQMRNWIREAVDALYGQSSLRSELDRFLAHCDDKANTLLALYRDANRDARPRTSTADGKGSPTEAPQVPAPSHFHRPYAFPEIMLPPPAEMVRNEAIQEQKQVSELVSKAIGDVETAYSASIAAYPSIQELEASLISGLDVFGHRPQPLAGDSTAADDPGGPTQTSFRVARLHRGGPGRS